MWLNKYATNGHAKVGKESLGSVYLPSLWSFGSHTNELVTVD